MASIWRRRDREDNDESESQKREAEKHSVFATPPASGASPFKVDAAPSTESRARGSMSSSSVSVPVPTPPPYADSSSSMMRDAGTTLLGKDISFKGELKGSGSVKVDGFLEGSVVLDRELTILRNGRVHATVEADVVHVDGELEGNVIAKTKIIISSSGRMLGDVRAKSVVVSEGASFKGRIEMDLGDEAPKGKAKEKAAAPAEGKPAAAPAPKPGMQNPRPKPASGESAPFMTNAAPSPFTPPGGNPKPGASPFADDQDARPFSEH